MEEVINGILIREVETKNIMTKSSLPVGGYSVNPYVGCTHACKYCYASFMKRFTKMTEREEFLDIFHRYVTRPGSEKLLDWLDHKTDFFTAPASTRFHGACEGGLCMHSLNVYHALHDTFFTEGDSEETFAICALLHDLCKANYYKPGTRNVKNEATGQWEKVPSYSVEDLFPYGHGEKSVFLIERFMKLKVEEAVAIRWHMGGFDDAARGGCFAISEAYDKYPLAVKLHIADLQATYLMEHRTSNMR